MELFCSVYNCFMNKKEQISFLENENKELKKNIEELNRNNSTGKITERENSIKELEKKISVLKNDLSFIEGLNDEIEFGIYNPDLDFLHNDYIEEWDNQKKVLREISKDKDTIQIEQPMKLGGSQPKGIKLQKDVAKLGIVHLNNFAKTQFKNINQSNFENQQIKFDKEFNKINKILANLNVKISNEFFNTLLDSFEYVMKMKMQKEDDKEIARLERERIKEEEKLKAEIDKKISIIDNEVEKYNLRIEKIKKESSKDSDEKDKEIEKLKAKIAVLENNSEVLENRLKRTGSGYVYIISNIGSFGEGVYKIGVTRRLEPEIRIRELSSASVPFIFDKHALIWSEKAFKLESQLHKALDNKRVNKVNKRKEFFNTTLDDIKHEVQKITDTSIKWITEPEAIQYRLTLEVK